MERLGTLNRTRFYRRGTPWKALLSRNFDRSLRDRDQPDVIIPSSINEINTNVAIVRN